MMKKNINSDSVTFSMSKTRRKVAGGFIASIGFFVSSLLIFAFVIEPIFSNRHSTPTDWSSIDIGDVVEFLLSVFIFSLVTIFPIVTGLYFFLKDIPQIRIEKDRLYYSGVCTSAEKKLGIFFPSSHSVEDYSFAFASVHECTFNLKHGFFIHFVFKGSTREPVLTLSPVVSNKDKETIVQLISERIKKK